MFFLRFVANLKKNHIFSRFSFFYWWNFLSMSIFHVCNVLWFQTHNPKMERFWYSSLLMKPSRNQIGLGATRFTIFFSTFSVTSIFLVTNTIVFPLFVSLYFSPISFTLKSTLFIISNRFFIYLNYNVTENKQKKKDCLTIFHCIFCSFLRFHLIFTNFHIFSMWIIRIVTEINLKIKIFD